MPIPPSERECRVTSDGADYMGTISKTKSGRTCAQWDDPEIADHFGPLDTRIVHSMPDLEIWNISNYCRFPSTLPLSYYTEDPAPRAAWCYVWENGRRDLKREECTIPLCGM